MSKQTILNTLHLPTGFEFDIAKAYATLITSQFGGHPARGAAELVQNAVDSYDPELPLKKRHIALATTKDSFSVRDKGHGLGLDRLRLLVTLGGSDKSDDPRKLGTFGMGFFAVLNPKLGTRRVRVVTRLGPHAVRLSFEIDPAHPLKLPAIRTEVMDGLHGISGTEVTVEFNNDSSAGRCLEEARKFLRYLPCRVTLNGSLCTDNVWSEADLPGSLAIAEDPCVGFLRPEGHCSTVTVLCKYERVLTVSLAGLSTGGFNVTHDLRDLCRGNIPLVPPVRIVINHNGLRVTVSRDSVMMDGAYKQVVATVAKSLFRLLGDLISENRNAELIPANQFLFAARIRGYLESPLSPNTTGVTGEVISQLANAQVYRLSGRKERVSLNYIHQLRSADRPVFYSPGGSNLRWLGGAFEHDFIVLPPECPHFGHNPGFYDELFQTVFKDCVNLETIQAQTGRIQDLVARGIVDPEALTPKYEFLGTREITPEEQDFMGRIDTLLRDSRIRLTILQTLHLPDSDIHTTLFDFHAEGITVATGLFDDQGMAFANVDLDQESAGTPARRLRTLRLGLMRTHPVIRNLIESKDPHRAYFALTFLAHELVGCQRMLAPYSTFRNWVIGELSRNLRRVLVEQLLESKHPNKLQSN